MKSQLSRKTFLYATAATTLASVLGCSSEDEGADDAEGGDGDGDSTGSGGTDTWGDGDGDGTGGGDGDGDGTGGGDGDGTGGGDGDGDGTGGTGDGDGDGSGGSDTSTGGNGGGDVCTEDIDILSSGEHMHTMKLTAGQLSAGVEVTLTSSAGAGDHTHCVTLTAGEIATIKAGGTVKKTTCNGGDHEFVFSCDAGADAPILPTTCVDEGVGSCG